MDDDLKIVLTSELEADEEASANRISAQLHNISELINSKGRIKVDVVLDEANIQSQTQKLTQQMAQAAKTHGIGISLNLNQSSVDKIRAELDALKVSPDISRAMTEQLTQMGIQIDKISGKWHNIGTEEERILSLTIQGTDQYGRIVSYLQTYNEKAKEGKLTQIAVTQNLEKQRQAEERLAAKAKQDNESRISYLNQQKNALETIYAKYADLNSVKPIHNADNFADLDRRYQSIFVQITELEQAEGKLSAQQKVNISNQISELDRLVKSYQNVEYVATKLRTKTAVEVNANEVEKLKTYEEGLRNAGILTQKFEGEIETLRTQLSQAFDSGSLTAYLNAFDRLDGEVDSFKAKIQSVNSLYKDLSSVSTKIASLQKQMSGMDQSSAAYAGKARELELLQSQELELGKQISAYRDVIQYSSQAAQYEMTRLNLQAQIATSEAAVADVAKQISASMSTVGTTVDTVEAKFRALTNPTDELREKVANLRTLMAAIGNSGSNSEQVALFKQLNQEIAQCNKQITNLNGQSRLNIGDAVFAENLKKAKFDLEEVGRKWSALKSDSGLNAQFDQLRQNLNQVNNQMDLRRWRSQFSAFKSEVKAAGKNMQSLGDTLKNNVSKVLQWVSATTLLFRAFRILKSAVSTIVDLDTAMIDLQKVTSATRAEYDRFYRSANDTAKALGVTTQEVISQTAEWSRLGLT